MRFRPLLVAILAILVFSPPVLAQDITEDAVTAFIKGRQAEKPELEKVGANLDELDEKIKKWRDCAAIIQETMSGLKAKVALKAKCGQTSDEGFRKERNKLLAAPEQAGAAAAGMDVRRYVKMKEVVTMFLNGDRSFGDSEVKAMMKHASALSDAMGIALAKAGSSGGNSGGGLSGRLGNAIAGRMTAMMTPAMTWAYVSYLWGLMFMSGATMFETPYQPGQWTQWEIADASQPDSKVTLERAMLSREADKSEWWRIKTTSVENGETQEIVLEALFKPLDEQGQTMQVVRMKGKLPGDTQGNEMMVPENLAMISMNGLGIKPTKESLAGATVGTESIKVGSASYSAKHVRFANAGGSMNWWIADKAPGSVVKVEFLGQEEGQKWTMAMTKAGTGAKSELGVK